MTDDNQFSDADRHGYKKLSFTLALLDDSTKIKGLLRHIRRCRKSGAEFIRIPIDYLEELLVNSLSQNESYLFRMRKPTREKDPE